MEDPFKVSDSMDSDLAYCKELILLLVRSAVSFKYEDGVGERTL